MNEIETTLKEILEHVHNYRNDYKSNEQAVRTQLIEPILNILGWKTSNPKFVKPNAPNEDGKIPDYKLIKNDKIILIVEAKNLSIDLQNNNIIDQLANYCFNLGIDFGILTNGVKWLLFKTFEKNPKDRIIWQIDIEKDDINNVIKNLTLFSYSNIDKLDMLLKTSKLLDKGWNSLVNSYDSFVIMMSQKLLDVIKKTESTFKIDSNDLNSFTKSKLNELFESNDLERNEKEDENDTTQIKSGFTEVENKIFKRNKKTKERVKIKVKFSDNSIIEKKNVVDTFVETIIKIGPEKIKPLNLTRCGVSIISESKDNYYSQYQFEKYWIMTQTSTKEKIAILKEIISKLNLKLIIETYKITI